ncbi:hypothetical protein Tco_0737593 [Tanacetum coccineum]
MCCYRPDTSICNLHDRSARRSRAQVKRSRDGASGASTATKCSLAQKRPCGILTGLLTSGGLEFGKCYSLPALSGPWIGYNIEGLNLFILKVIRSSVQELKLVDS